MMNLEVNLMNILIKLSLATVLGGLVGFERAVSRKPAGMRTYILISLGACLFSEFSVILFQKFPESVDLSRIASQIVMGVGFIGAGTIMRSGTSVGGLTTAAAIWVVAAIGTLVGFGLYAEAGLATLFVFIVLILLTPIEKKIVAGVHSLKNKD
ncbi:MAG: MgtC/SapB family protein [Candidatus Margulisbacteria bacterium]|nr:MgtC/SapB family protein [Candidatus Margulisiibacteriota bacterium]